MPRIREHEFGACAASTVHEKRIDIRWRDGALLDAQLRGSPGGEARLRYRDKAHRVRVAAGRRVSVDASAFK